MTIAQDLQKAELPAKIDLFEIDATAITGSIYRYTPMTNGLGEVVFNGNTYSPYPIAITGIDQVSEGAPPRPLLAITNVDRFFGVLTATMQDLKGAKVIFYRTFEPYLNSGVSAAPMRFLINKKPTHNKTGIIFELKTFLDSDREFLPGRQMLRDGPPETAFPGLGVNKSIS